MASKIQEVERDMFEYLKAADYTFFIQTFNLYLGLYPTTEDTLYLKSVALLYHLGSQSMREYYTLLQSLRIGDLGSESIQFVLRAEDAVTKCDIQCLNELLGGCDGRLKSVMQMLISGVSTRVEKVLAEDIGQNDAIVPGTNDNHQNIRDCLFVCREFLEN